MTVIFSDILAANQRIRPYARVTPLLEDPTLNAQLGGRLLIKAEGLQVRGSFKIRGAANAMLARLEEARAHGVVAFSSGNHAQAIAYMGMVLGIRSTIVVPSDAPAGKLARVVEDGATLITYDRVNESREAIGAKIAAETGAIMIKPFDDELVIAGQGTLAVEAIAQAGTMGARIDRFVVCASGGGLAAGISVAAQTMLPNCAITTAEPSGHDDMAQSLASGVLVTNPPGMRSFQDALLTATAGDITFPLLQKAKATGVSVSDQDAMMAMKTAWQRLGLVLEPGGAAALAAVLAGKVALNGQTVCVTASGSNADAEIFAKAIL
jgi:threonine dehydratase